MPAESCLAGPAITNEPEAKVRPGRPGGPPGGGHPPVHHPAAGSQDGWTRRPDRGGVVPTCTRRCHHSEPSTRRPAAGRSRTRAGWRGGRSPPGSGVAEEPVVEGPPDWMIEDGSQGWSQNRTTPRLGGRARTRTDGRRPAGAPHPGHLEGVDVGSRGRGPRCVRRSAGAVGQGDHDLGGTAGWPRPGWPSRESPGTGRWRPTRTTRTSPPGRRCRARRPARRSTACRRSADRLLGLRRRAEVVVLPGRPEARFVAGPVVGLVPTGVERDEEGVELGTARASPPIRSARADRSWGTDQVYWTALPSSKPARRRARAAGLEGRPGGKLPSAFAGLRGSRWPD